MIAADGAVGVLLFGLWVFCIIDVITTPEPQIRNLPKLAWLFIVIILVDIGSLAWLIAGRNWQGGGASRTAATRFPEYERPGRHVAQNPDDDDAFLAQVRSRAEAQRRQYEERRRRDLAAEDEALRKRPETDN